MSSLPSVLRDLQAEIKGYADEFGLDTFPVLFEPVDYRHMCEIAAYDGFPTRYPHWRFGMEYDRLSKSYAYGLSKIYEMVINTDPCYAYLLTANSLMEQKLVMAHVFGHSDFFKNNQTFAHTNRRMLDTMANHATRVRRHHEAVGVERVEEFMDACLSLDNLIDIHAPSIRRRREAKPEGEDPSLQVQKIPVKSYLDKYVNSPEYIESQKQKIAEEKAKAKRFPESPERDVLGFLLQNAPLEAWQQDCLTIVREEALYFAPQGQTKIMNEGWASYWHSKLMTEGILSSAEIVDYADVHSGTMAVQPGGLNPYRLGLELYKDIEERWNKGQFGKEWDECDDYLARQTWDKKTGLGRQKIFEVRKLYNDVTFIDTFLTEDFCRRKKLFTFATNERTGEAEIESREFREIKQQLLAQLTNFGQPIIEVVDANHLNRGELLLKHVFEGRDLRPDYTDATLRNLYAIWRRPVNLETIQEGKLVRLAWNGKESSRVEV